MNSISKRKLARGFVRLRQQRSHAAAVRALAAAIKTHRLTNELELVVREVAAALAREGTMLARVTTAQPLSEKLRTLVTSYLRSAAQAQHLHCDFQTDPRLLGGCVIETPQGTLDASVAGRLERLR